jgi:tRNA threonylcarbamoyl adenosine modification protein (Sua5/YciO/YrdC/YwlC family)
MRVRIDTEKPDERRIQQVVDCLKAGGIIIYPTDTVYTMGCDYTNKEAYHRLCKLKNIQVKKSNFSLVCSDYSHLSLFSKQLSNSQFRTLSSHLPGPFTFILEATKEVQKIFDNNKKTVGYRIPDHGIPKAIVETLGNPIFSTSIKLEDDDLEYMSDPDEIYYMYEGVVDMFVDGGACGFEPSTIVDLTSDDVVVIREGKGKL